jgi:formylglycine-generating enzyme required for sulfatase activity
LKIVDNTGGLFLTAGQEDNPYVNWSANGYRLATGAEWEYAFRYVTISTFTPDTAPSGWVDSNSNATVDTAENDAVGWSSPTASTQPVGGKAPNTLGAYDMSGNAYELVWDWNGTYSNASPFTDADSKGPNSGTARDVRGGCYGVAATFMVANWHGSTTPDAGDFQRGFRVVRRP